MAFLEVKNVRIAGMAAGVPQKVVCNLEIENISNDYDAAAFVEVTGVKERRFDELTVSDMAVPAVERLLHDLGWSKDEVDGLFVVVLLNIDSADLQSTAVATHRKRLIVDAPFATHEVE